MDRLGHVKFNTKFFTIYSLFKQKKISTNKNLIQTFIEMIFQANLINFNSINFNLR